MGFVFHVLFPLIIIMLIWAAYTLIRRTRERRAAWESGLSARARVVRAYVRVRMVNNVARRIQYHEYDFVTADGRPVRFEEAGGPPSRGEGDETVVYYTSEQPEKATASEPVPGKDMTRAVLGVGVIGVGVVILLNVMIKYG
ncbi:hypothetical protein FBY35_4013 [Streptomyces sp. SLBN-118]|nr:hypothetical protein FBY35_4013 [Streptomyces sp. SLBN-118]